MSVTQEDTCTGTTLINGFGETETRTLAVPNGLSKGAPENVHGIHGLRRPGEPVVTLMSANVSFKADPAN